MQNMKEPSREQLHEGPKTQPQVPKNYSELKANWKIVKDPAPPAVKARSAELNRTMKENEQRVEEINGKWYLFRVETHTWFGGDPTKKPTAHRGITVYEQK